MHNISKLNSSKGGNFYVSISIIKHHPVMNVIPTQHYPSSFFIRIMIFIEENEKKKKKSIRNKVGGKLKQIKRLFVRHFFQFEWNKKIPIPFHASMYKLYNEYKKQFIRRWK